MELAGAGVGVASQMRDGSDAAVVERVGTGDARLTRFGGESERREDRLWAGCGQSSVVADA